MSANNQPGMFDRQTSAGDHDDHQDAGSESSGAAADGEERAFDPASPVPPAPGALIRVDPRLCAVFAGNGRAETVYDPDRDGRLTRSIAKDGQVVPGQLRWAPDGKGRYFEVVTGSRRLRSIATLCAAGRAIAFRGIVVALSDEQSFRAATAENLGRAQLLPMQLARSWNWLLHALYAGNQERLAEGEGEDPATVSRTLSLLELPDTILSAHVDPERITVHFAEKIVPVLRDSKRCGALLRAAEALVAGGQRLTGPRLVEHLLLPPDRAEALRPVAFSAGTTERAATWKSAMDGSARLSIRARSDDLTIKERRVLFDQLRQRIAQHLGLEK